MGLRIHVDVELSSEHPADVFPFNVTLWEGRPFKDMEAACCEQVVTTDGLQVVAGVYGTEYGTRTELAFDVEYYEIRDVKWPADNLYHFVLEHTGLEYLGSCGRNEDTCKLKFRMIPYDEYVG